jgi:hypothetical protein
MMKRELQKIAIVALATILSLALHALAPSPVPLTPDRLSIVANALSFVGTVTLFFLVTYYLIATLFLKFEHKLSGRKLHRALLFGCLVGGIWWVGMIEGMFAFGTDFAEEFLMGLLDFIPIVALCLLLAIFMVQEKAQPRGHSINWGVALVEAGLFSILFVAGRTIRYLTIGAGYELEELAAVMLWTAVFAVMIALNYAFLKSTFQKGSVKQSALRFTFILFGLHYMLFVYFVPLIFSGLFFDLTIVLVYDLILVLLASILTGELTAELSTQMMPETISYETTNH